MSKRTVSIVTKTLPKKVKKVLDLGNDKNKGVKMTKARKLPTVTTDKVKNLDELFKFIKIEITNEVPPEATNGRGRKRQETPFDQPLQDSFNDNKWRNVIIPTDNVKAIKTLLGQVATFLNIGVKTRTKEIGKNKTQLYFLGGERTKRPRKDKS